MRENIILTHMAELNENESVTITRTRGSDLIKITVTQAVVSADACTAGVVIKASTLLDLVRRACGAEKPAVVLQDDAAWERVLEDLRTPVDRSR